MTMQAYHLESAERHFKYGSKIFYRLSQAIQHHALWLVRASAARVGAPDRTTHARVPPSISHRKAVDTYGALSEADLPLRVTARGLSRPSRSHRPCSPFNQRRWPEVWRML
jgi:hypothetical protein